MLHRWYEGGAASKRERDGDGMIDKRDMDHRMCHAPVTYKGRVFDVIHQICNGWTSNVIVEKDKV